MKRIALVFKRIGWWHRNKIYEFEVITIDYSKKGSLEDDIWSIKLKDCYLVLETTGSYKAIPKEDLIIISKNIKRYLLTIR